MISRGDIKTVEDAVSELERLDRRVLMLERLLRFSAVAPSPVANVPVEQRFTMWYDVEDGKLNIESGDTTATFTKD